jgi:1-acyl-sn-glycerol-3-phosphate acyltransferase
MATSERSTTAADVEEPRRPGPRQLLFAAYAWVVFVLLVIPLWLGVVLLPRMGWRWAIVRGASRLLLSMLQVPMVVRGEARLAACAPCVIVANHASYTDSLILAAALPGPFIFTPLRSFERHFISRVFMARLGSLFVGGGGRGGDAERIAATVRAGRSVVVFPEGAVHTSPGLRPFRSGAFVAAVQAQAAVSCVAIQGSRKFFRHHSWLPRWSAIAVNVLPPQLPEGTGPEEVERLSAAARRAIAEQSEEASVDA